MLPRLCQRRTLRLRLLEPAALGRMPGSGEHAKRQRDFTAVARGGGRTGADGGWQALCLRDAVDSGATRAPRAPELDEYKIQSLLEVL